MDRPRPDPPAVRIAGLLHAEKRIEQPRERVFGYARSLITHGNNEVPPILRRGDADRRALRRIANGIAQHVFNRAAQKLPVSEHRRFTRAPHVEYAAAKLGFHRAIPQHFFHHRADRYRLGAVQRRIALDRW